MTPAVLVLLEERYPDIAFYLHLQPLAKIRSWEGFFVIPPIEEVEILYFFGIDNGKAFYSLRSWLEKPGRILIFLEENWNRLTQFLQTAAAEELLSHPKVLLQYIPEKSSWPIVLEECAQRFPSDRIACIPLSTCHEASFEKRQLQLLRSSGALSALYSDVLHADRLFANIQANFPKLLQGFDANIWEGAFANIPAVICGAGPSLEKSFSILKECKNRALILAGGSAIASLLQENIQPHLGMALDPNEEERMRLHNLHELTSPLLCSPRLQRAVIDRFSGPLGYLYSATGGLVEEWLRTTLHLESSSIGECLGREAFSVTTLAVAYAHFLGCNPIVLTGVDLAYTEGRRYAKGILYEEESISSSVLEKRMMRKNKRERSITTSLKWIMEAGALSDFAKAHPACSYINATQSGLSIKGFKRKPLREIVDTWTLQEDLSSRIENQVQLTRFKKTHSWNEALDQLKDSLEHSKEICQKLQQVGKKAEAALCFALSEEVAYTAFLEGIEAALECLLIRYIPVDEEERRAIKWKEMELACLKLQNVWNTPLVYCAECAH